MFRRAHRAGRPSARSSYSAELTVNGVFSAVAAGAWVAFWTPYNAGVGSVNVAATVASPAGLARGAQ